MTADDESEIPGSGAVYTFGRSRIADNILNHFYIRDDPIVDIGCGDEHTIVICHSGRSFSFGSNNWGQLGLGHRSIVQKPNCIKSLKPMKSLHVACGRAHSLVLTDSNQVFAFGNNSDGQLGIGSNQDTDLPKPVENLADVQQLSAGCNHSVALTNGGKVFVWGSNSEGQLGLGSEITGTETPQPLKLENCILQVACGYYHTVLLTGEGNVFVFGEGESGKLGLGDAIGRSLPTHVPIKCKVTEVSAGGHHTAAITDRLQVLVWGSNESGQIGLGEGEGSLSPTVVPALSDTAVKMVSCGESHTAFLADDGQLLICGEARHGKLGLEMTNGKTCQREPVKIQKFTNFFVHKVRCGGCHTEVLALPVKNTDASIDGPPKLKPISESTSSSSSRISLPPLQKVPGSNVYPCRHPALPPRTVLPAKTPRAPETPESTGRSQSPTEISAGPAEQRGSGGGETAEHVSDPPPERAPEEELYKNKKLEEVDEEVIENRRISSKSATTINSKGQSEGKMSRFFNKMKKSTSQSNKIGASNRNSSVHIPESHKKSKMCVII